MTTILKKIDVDWTEIKNECRNTIHKEDTNNEPSDDFIKKLLISEHSPIRLGLIKWRWKDIKYWIVGHFVRHHIGVEKWVSTQRSDRTGINRDKLPQDSEVNLDMCANIQALINMARYRLCFQAAKETRQYMEALKIEIGVNGQDKIADVMVPNCVYRCGCSEFTSCEFFERFKDYCKKNDVDITDIQQRYDAYNKYFSGVNFES